VTNPEIWEQPDPAGSAHSLMNLVSRCRALELLMPSGVFFGRVTAARLWEMPLPQPLEQRRTVEVAVDPQTVRPLRPGLNSLRATLPVGHVVALDDLPVTSPARTWLDLATVLAPAFLLAAGDHLLRSGLASREDLASTVKWARGRRGVVSARALVDALSDRAESPRESQVRYWLRHPELPDPEVNFDVVVDRTWLARADLAYRDYRIAVEYDGIVHLDEQRRRSDARRRNLLQDNGWFVIVFTADDLRDPRRMRDLVRHAIDSRRPPERRPHR